MLETFQKIWQFSKNRHQSLIRGLIFSFLRSIFGITQIVSILLTLQVLTGNLPVDTGICAIAVLTILCILGNFFTSYIEQVSTMETGFFMTGDKRVSVAGHLRKLPLGYFNQSASGKIAATLTTTLAGVENGAAMAMVGIVSGFFNSFSMLIFMLIYDWRIGLITLLGMAAYLAVVNWQMNLSRKNAPALEKAQSGLAQAALTFLQGIRVIKAFDAPASSRDLNSAIAGSRDGNLKLTDQSMPSQFAAGVTIALFEALIFLASLFFFFQTGGNSVSKTILLIIFSFMVYGSLNQAGSMLSMIGMVDSGLDEAQKIENAQQLPIREPLQACQENRIVLNHVSFSYGDNQVLQDISTVIEPHTLTAIIGPSGSGKTTLCQLIPRFRDVSAGEITIGGADIRSLPYEELMQKISMVFQDVYLFEDTIANNIRFGRPDATLEEVRAAAKAARCDDFIMELPQGYDTMVSEGGSSLSGGEKQRISIARAMLKDSPIIILDEATSALDAENEHEILSAIDALTRDKTVIMIAHRIKTVEKADHIIALKDGTIVQEGTHETLKDRPGLYRDFLCSRAQAAGWQL